MPRQSHGWRIREGNYQDTGRRLAISGQWRMRLIYHRNMTCPTDIRLPSTTANAFEPLCPRCGMRRHTEVHDPPPLSCEHEKAIEHVKSNVGDGKKVDGEWSNVVLAGN